MQPPSVPPDEDARVSTLLSLNLLDTEPEERFDRLTRIARKIFSVPIALVTLVDTNRQWFKSKSGLGVCETSREISFCGHAILSDEILHVPDALADRRFADNPLVVGYPHIRFYAGCPLTVGTHKMGTLCLIDTEPRPFSDEEKQLLRDLASMAEQNLVAEHLASTDALTKLVNRRGFEAFARQALAICARMGNAATLVYFDLDGFKRINDWFGHAEGDRALRTFASGLVSVFRESDAVARLGGDEFAVLLTDSSPVEARYAISRLRRWIGEENRLAGRGYEIRFSAGEVSLDTARHQSIEEMLREADAAMYREKDLSRASQQPLDGDRPA